MSAQFLFALLIGILGGVAVALQAPVNARLAAHAGDAVTAATISFVVGLVVLAGVMLARTGLPDGTALAGAPWWAWTGGAIGALYVWSAVASVGTLGVVTLMAALIFGQLTAALMLDATGAFGLPVQPISLTRLAAVGCVALGLVLSRV